MPSIFAVFRNLVWEIWFEKSGSRNLVQEIWFEKSGSTNSDFFSCSRKVVDQKKGGFILQIHLFFRLEKSGSANSDFFFWFEKSGWPEKKIKFVEPLFYNFLEKWLQIKCSSIFSDQWNYELPCPVFISAICFRDFSTPTKKMWIILKWGPSKNSLMLIAMTFAIVKWRLIEIQLKNIISFYFCTFSLITVKKNGFCSRPNCKGSAVLKHA